MWTGSTCKRNNVHCIVVACCVARLMWRFIRNTPTTAGVCRTFVQATTGHGGWPMSVWLTPDLEPVYGGTYYPKKDMFQVGLWLGGCCTLPSSCRDIAGRDP